MSIKESKSVFIICPIGDPDSDSRKRSDLVKRHIIDPVAGEKGYSTSRADLFSEPGRIDHQIIDHLLNEELVVADITENNANVFYELAVRHSTGKPLILMGQKGERIPFDVSAQRVIFYDLQDLDNVESSKHELKRQIESVESDTFIMDSPIRAHVPLEIKERDKSKTEDMKEVIAILRNQGLDMRRFEDLIVLLTKSLNREESLYHDLSIGISNLGTFLNELDIKESKNETKVDEARSSLLTKELIYYRRDQGYLLEKRDWTRTQSELTDAKFWKRSKQNLRKQVNADANTPKEIYFDFNVPIIWYISKTSNRMEVYFWKPRITYIDTYSKEMLELLFL